VGQKDQKIGKCEDGSEQVIGRRGVSAAWTFGAFRLPS
jgi:hypothetical protein